MVVPLPHTVQLVWFAALLYDPVAHAAQLGFATSLLTMYFPAADVTLYVGVGHALPLYVTVFALIVAQLLGVSFVGPVNLHAVFAVDPSAELNVPDVYPLG